MATAIADFDPVAARNFRPTADQRRLLNTIHDYPSIRTVREFCEACDVGRRTYYNWCKNPHFRLWFATVWSARIITEGTTLINQARAKASYKFSYWKALADLTFDPRGLALLQKWQQAMFSLDGSAFDSGPEADRDYDFHFDPTSECDDGKTPQAPLDGKPATVAALEASAENGTFHAKLSNASTAALPAIGSASSLPTPVAVARVFRKALAPPRRYSCIAHHENRRGRARANRLTVHNAAQPEPGPQHNLNRLTETIKQTTHSNRLTNTNRQRHKSKPEQVKSCLTETTLRPAKTVPDPDVVLEAQRGRGARGPHARASISGWRGVTAPGRPAAQSEDPWGVCAEAERQYRDRPTVVPAAILIAEV
ncbi:MAG TPA: hypothetical protein VN709_10790 [Terriglobales bacterium]|nr:hypothetical protein [Terriglobales bacterium]